MLYFLPYFSENQAIIYLKAINCVDYDNYGKYGVLRI